MLVAEQKYGVLILNISGRIDGSNAFEFQNKVEESVVEGNTAVVLDLTDLVYISSAGLRVILLLAKNLKSQKVKLVMCSVIGPVKDVFTISGFNAIIPTYDTKAGALSAIG